MLRVIMCCVGARQPHMSELPHRAVLTCTPTFSEFGEKKKKKGHRGTNSDLVRMAATTDSRQLVPA